MARITRNEIYNHLGDALHNALPEDGSAELGMDHNKLFIRMAGQVFAITVEEKEQFARASDPEKEAKRFMTTLPYWPWDRH